MIIMMCGMIQSLSALRTVFSHAFWRIYANFSLITPSNTYFGLIYANFCSKRLITQIFPDPPYRTSLTSVKFSQNFAHITPMVYSEKSYENVFCSFMLRLTDVTLKKILCGVIFRICLMQFSGSPLNTHV